MSDTNAASSKPATVELLDIEQVCAFFGGSKPLHPATIYRGIGKPYPAPVKIGPNTNCWLKSECEAVLRLLMDGRAA